MLTLQTLRASTLLAFGKRPKLHIKSVKQRWSQVGTVVRVEAHERLAAPAHSTNDHMPLPKIIDPIDTVGVILMMETVAPRVVPQEPHPPHPPHPHHPPQGIHHHFLRRSEIDGALPPIPPPSEEALQTEIKGYRL